MMQNPIIFCYNKYGKRHNKFLLPVLVRVLYESFYKAESKISNVVPYKIIYYRCEDVEHEKGENKRDWYPG